MKTAACILTLLLITCPARGQLFAEASQTLREADHVKMVLGDLDRAATLYEGVAESPSASRSDVARALYSLAEVTEPSDPEEAARLYQRVATEFPDVSASFQAARDALQRLGSTSDVAAYDYTLIMEEMPPTNIERFRHFAVSPDGERFAVVAPATETRRAAFPDLQREVYISDLGGGVRRPLVEDPTSLPWMHNPRWSPNGRYVAVQSQSAEGFGVVVVNVATGESSVYEGPDWTSNRPVVWMPDSETFLLMQGQEIGYRSIRGDVVRDIPFGRELESEVRPGGVSPDGQYLLYQSRSENSELNFELDIWVMELTTGQHRQLTSDLGTEAFPFWNADGTAFFFSQGTEHVRNIVRQTFDDRAERSGITSYLNARATHPVYLARSGKLAFVLATTNSRVMKSEGGTSEPLVRGQMAELSPDGETVYYLSTEPGRTGLWAAELDGSSGTRLMSGQVSASYVQPQYISPDGSTVALARHEGDDTVIYILPSGGGPATELFRASEQLSIQPFWSPSGGELVFSTDGDIHLVEIESGEHRLLSSAAHYWEGWSLNWSPDGSRIAAFGYPEEGGEDMHVMLVDAGTGETSQLTPDDQPHYKEGLDWHPDGNSITYMYYGRDDDAWGGDGTEIIDIETGEIRTLVDLDDLWDYIGIWGPDGAYYFITSPPGFGNEWMLYRHDVDDAINEATVIDGSAERSHRLPSFSRDGSVMIYDQSTYNNQLWMIDGIR